MKKIISVLLSVIMLAAFIPCNAVYANNSITGQTVSLGWDNSAAIKEDGSLWMWGDNWFGQLGDVAVADSVVPVKIMDDVATVSLESNHSAVIKEDGSLWMWGSNWRQAVSKLKIIAKQLPMWYNITIT